MARLSHKLALEKKHKEIEEVKESMSSSKIIILTDYRGNLKGLTVKEISSFRKILRDKKAQMKIVKNTLINKAAKEIGISGLEKFLEKPTAVIYGKDDPVLTAKAVVEFSKEQKKSQKDGLPIIKAAYFDGAVMDASQVGKLAELPPKEVLLSRMVGSISSPLRGLVNVVQGNLRNLVYVLQAIKTKKEETV